MPPGRSRRLWAADRPAGGDQESRLAALAGRSACPHGLDVGSHDDYRAGRVAEAVTADRAQQHAGEPVVTAAADHQQAGLLAFSSRTVTGCPSTTCCSTSTSGEALSASGDGSCQRDPGLLADVRQGGSPPVRRGSRPATARQSPPAPERPSAGPAERPSATPARRAASRRRRRRSAVALPRWWWTSFSFCCLALGRSSARQPLGRSISCSDDRLRRGDDQRTQSGPVGIGGEPAHCYPGQPAGQDRLGTGFGWYGPRLQCRAPITSCNTELLAGPRASATGPAALGRPVWAAP